MKYPIAFNSGTSSRERGRDPGPMPSLDGPSPKLLAGIAFYVVTAAADTLLTLQGVNGDLQLEGNPIMQAAMEHLGMGLGLVTQKAAIGGGALFIAVAGERAIRRDEPWIWKIPTTRWVRDWMRRKDRSWIAFIPLYAAATGQTFAVASWLALMAAL